MEGSSLDERLKENRTKYAKYHNAFKFEKKIGIIRDIVEGMRYLHLKSIIHRDLKPAVSNLPSFICITIAEYSLDRTRFKRYSKSMRLRDE